MEADHRFNNLLARYLNNVATQQEHKELMQLIHEGNHDELIKNSIDASFSDDAAQDMSMERAQEMLKHIILTEKQPAKVVRLQTWKWVAAAAVVMISITAGWWLYTDQSLTEQPFAQTVRKETSVFTGKQFIHLPDGSTVLLNENSELTYTDSFGKGTREVTLKGEGFFDIQHDPSRPFKVLTGKITTTVLGTAFNVKAYEGGGEVKVTVTRGKVQVGDEDHTYGIITPNQQIAINTVTNEVIQAEVKAEAATEWKNNYLILDDVSMETAAAIIEDKYNVKIIFSNDELKSCRITATFLNGEDVKQILNVVSGVLRATYQVLPDGNVKLNGEGCR